MSYSAIVAYTLCLMVLVVSSKPTELQPATTDNEITYNPLSPSFKWTRYNIAAITTGGVVVAAGLALLTISYFPIFVYKICYALGGCQNTLDNYVDRFLGVEGQTRRIKRSDLSQVSSGMEYVVKFLKMAMEEYGSQPTTTRREKENIMSLRRNHQVGRRSPIDYIEPILVMLSKAYNEYVDPELKKNFNKLLFTS